MAASNARGNYMATALTADSAQRQLIAAEPLVIVRATVTAVTVTFGVTSRYRLPHTSRISRRASVLPSFASRWPLDFWPVQGRHAPSSTSRAPGTHSTGTRCMQTRKGTARRHRNSVGMHMGVRRGAIRRLPRENPRPLGVPLAARGGLRVNNLARSVQSASG